MGARKTEIRSSRLLEMLQLARSLEVSHVSESLGISAATVRRLFARLEREGKVIRTHGGVQLAPHLGTDYSYRLAAAHRSREKAAIGAAVARELASGERIYLDSGTTVLRLAEALCPLLQSGELRDLTVVTNSLALVEALARLCKVLLLGGEIRPERRDLYGSLSEKVLRQFHVNRAFLGADAVSLQGGFMTTDERTAALDEIVLRNAEHAWVLADAEKFRRESFVSYAALHEVERVVTDASIDEATLGAFRQAGARIEVAPLPARGAPRPQKG